MIRVTCTSCGASLKGADQLAGKTLGCPRCGVMVQVPSSRDVGATAALDNGEPVPTTSMNATSPETPEKLSPAKGPKNQLLWGIIAGLALLTTGLAARLFVLPRTPNETVQVGGRGPAVTLTSAAPTRTSPSPVPTTTPAREPTLTPRPSASAISHSPRADGEVLETVEITAQGDGKITRTIKLPLQSYLEWKSGLNHPVKLQRHFDLRQHWQLIENFQGRFEDSTNTLVLTWLLRGAARLGTNQLWESHLANEADVRIVSQQENEATLTATTNGGSLLTRIVRVPPGGARFCLLEKPGSPSTLAFQMPPAPAAVGSTRVCFRLDAQPRLMSCLGSLYGNPKFSRWWLARAVLTNTGDQPVKDYRVRLALAHYTAEWTEFQCPLVEPGQTVVDAYFPVLDLPRLAVLTADCPVPLAAEYQYRQADGTIVRERASKSIKVLARNQTLDTNLRPEEYVDVQDRKQNKPFYYAAFVTKDDKVIEELAGWICRGVGGAAASAKPEEATKLMAAVYAFMSAHIRYQTPAGDVFDGQFNSQTLMYGRDVLKKRAGTCADLAVLYASLCLAVGLEPTLVIPPGHCFPMIRLPNGAKIPVETTMIGKHSFGDAVKRGCQELDECRGRHTIVVDVCRSQARGVRPLPLYPDSLQAMGFDPQDLSWTGGLQKQRQEPANNSVVGRWQCTVTLPMAQGVEILNLTLNPDGNYAFSHNSVRWFGFGQDQDEGKYRVGPKHLTFQPIDFGEMHYEYRLMKRGKELVLLVPNDLGGKIPMVFKRIP